MVLKENAERERERGPYGEAKPPNLLIITLLGLPFLLGLFACPFCLHFRSYACAPSVHAINKEDRKPTHKQKR